MSAEILSVSVVVDDLASYDRKEVTVRGFLAIQHENHSIADDHRQEPSRSLWTEFHHATLGIPWKKLLEFDRKIVIATGIIKRQKRGHFGLFAATLNIRSLRLS